MTGYCGEPARGPLLSERVGMIRGSRAGVGRVISWLTVKGDGGGHIPMAKTVGSAPDIKQGCSASLVSVSAFPPGRYGRLYE